jgi:hypothetical protein
VEVHGQTAGGAAVDDEGLGLGEPGGEHRIEHRVEDTVAAIVLQAQARPELRDSMRAEGSSEGRTMFPLNAFVDTLIGASTLPLKEPPSQ